MSSAKEDVGRRHAADLAVAHEHWEAAEAARRARRLKRAALVIVVVALASGAAAYLLTRDPPPNYSLSATTLCLRAHGYAVSRVYRVEGFPAIDISGQGWHEPLPAVFTSSRAAAGRVEDAEVDSEPSPPRRNVALLWEGLAKDPLFACLRSR